jgi:hypothetical protein
MYEFVQPNKASGAFKHEVVRSRARHAAVAVKSDPAVSSQLGLGFFTREREREYGDG